MVRKVAERRTSLAPRQQRQIYKLELIAASSECAGLGGVGFIMGAAIRAEVDEVYARQNSDYLHSIGPAKGRGLVFDAH